MKLTRRAFGALAMGGLAGGLASRTAEAASAVPALPAGAIDCHIHIVGPQSKYPMAARRAYTPPEASVADLRKLRTEIGVPRQVVVQPSFYGFDNSCTLDAVAELGRSARAIAVVPRTVSDAELQRLDRAGVVGIRLNFATLGIPIPSKPPCRSWILRPASEAFRWHIQINTDPELISALAPIIGVIEHAGGVRSHRQPRRVARHPAAGFPGAARNGYAPARPYVKLSAPYNHLEAAGLFRRDAVHEGAHRRAARPHVVGHELAASRGRARTS